MDLTATDIVMLIVAIIVSLTIHEMTHAFVGHALGDSTAADEGRISLNPIRHIDPFMTLALPLITAIIPPHQPILAAKPVPFDPRNLKWDEFGAALIAVAGPLSNLVLAALASIGLHFAVGTSGGLLVHFLTIFMFTNVGLFVFNLVPIPPLDGSRVLYAFAPDGLRRVMEQIEPYGFFIVFGLIIAGGFKFVSTLVQMVVPLLPLSPFN